MDDQFIRQGPGGEIVGLFRQHMWQVQAQQYARYHCLEPHLIRLEDVLKGEGITLGRFSNTWAEDGILHPDNILRARFRQDSNLWYDFRTNSHCPTLVIESVGESTAPDRET